MLKPQGRIGEVAVELLTDFPERFEQRRTLSALLPGGARRELELEEFWEHKGRLIMKFAGIDSIDDAQALRGAQLQIARAQRAELEAGDAYVSDLVGCSVIASQGTEPAANIGTIADVTFGAGSAPLLVIHQHRGEKTRELMIPFATEYLVRLDVAAKRLEMALPEGMLDLDAPLSREEKDEQQRKS